MPNLDSFFKKGKSIPKPLSGDKKAKAKAPSKPKGENPLMDKIRKGGKLKITDFEKIKAKPKAEPKAKRRKPSTRIILHSDGSKSTEKIKYNKDGTAIPSKYKSNKAKKKTK